MPEELRIKEIMTSIYTEVKALPTQGKRALYIPELATVNPEKFGVFISSIDERSLGLGDYQEKFSIQSIAKVLSLCLAYSLVGEKIWDRVGVEPSGTAFNSLLQLEADNGIPRNPFINAGAMVVADVLVSELDRPKEEFLEMVRKISNNPTLNYSSTIAQSEKEVGYRNIALCHFLKSLNNIDNTPDEVLDFYFDLCSIEMTCEELTNLMLFLANNGKSVQNEHQVISVTQSKRINALMQTCGFYDESGEFAFRVGLPGKSGVGGGIIAIYPNKYAVSVWSPMLNEKGNSHKGMEFLERLTTQTQLSIF